MRSAYYPGCATKDSCLELDISTKRVFEKLKIDVMDLGDVAACCGAREMKVENPVINTALNARTLAMAQEQELDILTVCSTCQLTMTQVNNELIRNPELLLNTNRILSEIGHKYDGKTKVKHLLRFLIEDFTLEGLREHVTVTLNDARVAPFYGCHFLRPREEHGYKNPKEPMWLEDIILLFGGKPVLSDESRDACCGYPLLISNEKLAIRMAYGYLLQAKRAELDCVVTPCPLCHLAFDLFQSKIENQFDCRLRIPILHFSQLVGLAIGVPPRGMGFQRHMVPVQSLLDKIL